MISSISLSLPYIVLFSHVIFAFLFVSIFFRHSWGKNVADWFGRNAVVLSLSVSLMAVAGSLFYSEIVGFEPCVLCWWQRVFLYPSALILGIALYRKDRHVFRYATPLVLLSALVAFYQYYVTILGGTSLLSCTDEGGLCSKVYVQAFGYITIELMSLTASLFVLLFAWAHKIYQNENRHT